MTQDAAWVLVALVWAGSGVGGGAVLAMLAKRIHPGLSFHKLWLFYAVLLSVLAGVVFLIGWF